MVRKKEPILSKARIQPTTQNSLASGNSESVPLPKKQEASIGKLHEPTREELRNGPGRSQLPEKVQQMARKDTVCRFCGVSYLVFSEIKELEQKLLDAKTELEDAKLVSNNQRESNEEHEVLRQSIKQLQEAHHKLNFENETLKQETQNANDILKQQQDENCALRKVSQDHGALVKQLQNENQSLKQFRMKHEKSAAAKEAQYIKQIEMLKSQQQEHRLYDQKLIARLQQQVSVLKDGLRKAQSLFNSTSAEVSTLKTACREIISDMRTQVANAHDSLVTEVSARKDKQDSLLDSLRSKIAEQQEEYQSEAVILNQKLKVTLAQLKVAKSHLDSEKKRNQVQEEYSSRTSEEIASHNRKISQLKDTVLDLEDQLDSSRQKLKGFETINSRHESEIARLRNELLASKQGCDKLRIELDKAQQQIGNAHKDTIINLEHRIKEYETKLTQGKTALNDILGKSRSDRKQKQHLQEQLSKALEELELANRRQEMHSKECQKLQQEIQLLQEKTRKVVAEKERSESQFADLISKQTTLVEEKSAALTTVTEQATTIKSLTAQVKILDSLKGDIKDKETKLQAYASSQAEMQTKLLKLESQLDADRKSALSKQQEVMQLANERQRSQSARYASKLAALQSELKATSSKVEKLMEYKSKLDSANARIRELETQYSEWQTRLNDAKRELRTANAGSSHSEAEVDVSGLEEMEKYLIKLSNVVRQKESEIKSLQATIHVECEERTRLQIALEELQARVG